MHNVKDFGAKGDARRAQDASTTTGQATVTSAGAMFTQCDVGKRLWVTDPSTGNTMASSTVYSVQSPSQVTLSDFCIGNISNGSLVIGTDDSDAIRAAVSAAKSSSPLGTVTIPRGNYVFSKVIFDLRNPGGQLGLSIIGEGSYATNLLCCPTFDLSTTIPNGTLVNWESNNAFTLYQGFKVDGGGCVFDGTHYPMHATGDYGKWQDVQIVGFRGVTQGLYIAAPVILMERVRVEGIGTTGIVCVSGGTFLNCYSGNNVGAALLFINANGAKWIAGTVDESLGGGVVLQNSKEIGIAHALVYAADGNSSLLVDATSSARIVDCFLAPFNPANPADTHRTGVTNAGDVTLSCCHLDFSTQVTPAIANTGVLRDAGGNVVAGTTTGNPAVVAPIVIPFP